MKKIVLLLIGLMSILNTKALSVWDGVSSSMDWYTSSYDDTYYINSAADLAGLSNNFTAVGVVQEAFANKTIVLNCDIDLGGYPWKPIGNMTVGFAGSIDGQGHTISGLNVNNSGFSVDCYGLFGSFKNASNAVVSNLNITGSITLENYDSSQTLCVGGLTGNISGGSITFRDININVSISVNGVGNKTLYARIGELIGGNEGVASSINLHRVNSKGNVTVQLDYAKNLKVSGMVADGYGSQEFNESCVGGLVSASINYRDGWYDIGGFNGNGTSSYFSNCLFNGKIKFHSSSPNYSGAADVSCFSSSIAKSYNCCLSLGSLEVDGPNTYYGPFTSLSSSNYVDITNCYFISGTPRTNSYGIMLEADELQSGTPLAAFDTNIWRFEEGVNPYLAFTKAQYNINIALEGGYLGITLDKDTCFTFKISCDDNQEIFQVLWNEEDITNMVTADGLLTTPPILNNSILRVVYKNNGGNLDVSNEVNKIKFMIDGSDLHITNILNGSEITACSKDGRLVYNGNIIGGTLTLYNLIHDVYIIRIGTESFKLII